MLKESNKIYIFYYFMDCVLICLVFILVYYLRFDPHDFLKLNITETYSPNQAQYIFIFTLWGFLTILNLGMKNLYCTDRTVGILKEIRLVLNSTLTVSVFVGAIIFFTQYKFFSRFIFFTGTFLLFISLAGWRILKRVALRHLIRKGFHNFNVLFLGEDEMTAYLVQEMRDNSFLGLRPMGLITTQKKLSNMDLPILGSVDDFEVVCRKYFIDEVIISEATDAFLLDRIIKASREMSFGVRIVPFISTETPSILSIQQLGIVSLLTYREREHHPAEFFGKRIFDILCSSMLLLILSPLFCLISLLILVDSGRPIFYIQKRIGRKGEVFNFYKFRSMVKNAETLKNRLKDRNEVKDGVIFKMKDDPRVTPLGRLLRKYSLDELPQLWNVFKGNMSLVGPRPFPVDETKKFNINHMPRLMLRPGITGLAQVRGRSSLSFHQWIKWDLWYINNWSFSLDLKILFWTIPSVLKGKGAY